MKITKSKLKQIIKEQLNEFMDSPEPGDEELYRELIQKIGSSEDFDQLLYVYKQTWHSRRTSNDGFRKSSPRARLSIKGLVT